MNRRFKLFALLLAFLGLTTLTWAVEDAPAVSQAPQAMDVKINILGGQVKLTRVGKTLTDVFTQAFPLFEGDILETLNESKAELVYADGTTMRMKPLTKIQVQPTSLKVFKGQSWFKFTKRGTEFVIETPSLVAGIRGTTFDITVTSKGKSIVSVMEGLVAVRGAQGEEVLVPEICATSCESGEAPTPPSKFNPEKKRAEWAEKDWFNGTSDDVHQRFINYLNLKAEYGPNDPRTIEAQKAYEDARQILREKKVGVKKSGK